MSARGRPGRQEHGAEAPAEPATVVGRRVDARMGSVRFGGSGRPVLSVFNAAKGTARTPRVTLEANPTSPFARKLEPEKAISLSPRNVAAIPSNSRRIGSPTAAMRAPTETRVSTGHKLPQGQERLKRSAPSTRATRVAMARARESERNRRSVEHAIKDKEPDALAVAGKSQPTTGIFAAAVQEESGANLLAGWVDPSGTADVLDVDRSGDTARAESNLKNPSSTTNSTSGSQAFRLMEGAHRRPETTRKRFHVAFHPPMASVLAPQTDEIDRGTAVRSTAYVVDAARSSLTLSSAMIEPSDSKNPGRDVWRSVDNSINQIYEDPPIDLVKSTLFHANLAAIGQSRKRLKQKQHERILVAAEELRELKARQQVERDEAWRRKEQIQALSATIRRRNKKFARPIDGAETIGDTESRRNRDHHAQPVDGISARKPPVPRLSGSRGKASKRKRSQHRQSSGHSDEEAAVGTSAAASAGVGGSGAAASILLGDLPTFASVGEQNTNAREDASDLPHANSGDDVISDNQPSHRRSSKRRSKSGRLASSKKQVNKHGSDEGSEKVAEALDQRRAIAREYMLLQQHQRMVRKAEARQREQMEREKRQQKLEALEARRLENLKHSRKRRLPQQQQPRSQRRSKTRSKPAHRPKDLLKLKESGLDSDGEAKPIVNQDIHDSGYEPLSDAENDRSHGNTLVAYRQREPLGSLALTEPASPVIAASQSLLLGDGEPAPSASTTVKQQPGATNTHIQKLLDLRQKAQELSKQLNGIRSAQVPPKHAAPVLQSGLLESARSSNGDAGSISAHSPDRPLHFPEREPDACIQDVASQSTPTKIGTDDYDGESADSEVDESDQAVEDESDDGDDGQGSRDSDSDGNTNSDVLDTSRENELVDEGSIEELRRRDTITNAAGYDAPVAMANMSEVLDFDIRSIGVNSIAVVWPLAQDHSRIESSRRFSEVSSSAAASSSSQSGSSDEDHDEELREQDEDEHELVLRTAYRESDSDNDSGADVAKSPRKSERARRTSEEWSASKMAELLHSIDSISKFSPGSTEYARNDRVGFAMTTWRMDMESTPSDAFYQLVQAEDDSLSVIQRTALKLYERQRERERLRHENEKQQRQEDSTLPSPSESEANDNEDEPNTQQFARLDEIMQEVDRERSLYREALHSEESDTQAFADTDAIGTDDMSPGRVEILSSERGEVTASSEFWNHLVAEPVDQTDEVSEAEGHEPRQRRFGDRSSHHVEIDTSELEAQREQWLRRDEREAEEVDDDVSSLGDSSKAAGGHRRRVDSPRTLAKRLLAEVEYHEAINDAHIKLSMMEQAQLLEQAQAETINIATAFKEEMEQNAVNHQHALDHATLAKRFDDDLHDVVQQLHDIEGVEDQEHTAREIVAKIQLKRERMRECSVQTEDMRVADVGTSAPLQVDEGTSPILPSMSTAVQYEPSDVLPQGGGSPDSNPRLPISGEKKQPDEGKHHFYSTKLDDSEAVDYGDDGFEQESGLHARMSASRDDSDGEGDDIRSEVESVEGDVCESSKAESVIESAASLAESNGVSSKEASSAIEEEDDGVSDEAESIAARSEGEGHVESATLEYEDDFNASSTTAKAGFITSEVDDDFDVESNYAEDDGDTNNPSIEDVPDDSDRSHREVEEDGSRHITDSGKDAAIEDNFEEEFAHSTSDIGEEDEEELPEEDAAAEVSTGDHLSHPVDCVHKSVTAKPMPQSTDDGTLNTMGMTPIASEAHVRLLGALTSEFGYAQQLLAPPVPLYSQNALDGAQSDERVSQAYMAELERRKQSEASMLSLRLQAAEVYFAHQARRIDAAIADTNMDAAAKAELMAQKQRLTIAFMGEQANIESLKAAATARYFQDMLAFQSLYAGNASSIPVVNTVGLSSHHVWPATADMPVPAAAARVESGHATKGSVGAESECYENEFESATYDKTKNSRSSIADGDVKSGQDKEEDALENNKQPSDGSIESEFELVSEDQSIAEENEPQSDVQVEIDAEQDKSMNSVEAEDEGPKEEQEEAQSDEYAQSEFEDEIQDEPEQATTVQSEVEEGEHEVENEGSGSIVEENDRESGLDVSEAHEEADEGIDSDSIKSNDAEDDDLYNDDFASVSESVSHQDGYASAEGGSGDKPEDGEIKEDGASAWSVADSEHENEIASDISEDEASTAPSTVGHKSELAASAAGYSEDDFEESARAANTSVVATPTTLNVAESVVHSTSDDSSTTKLLVAEVDAIQKRVTGNRDPEGQFDKLARKKAKVVELLAAKDRLLQQQTLAFRLEEEKRMVDEAAHLALGLDVSQELREAKASIVSALRNEFDTLRTNFPRLREVEKIAVSKARIATDHVATPTPQAAPVAEQSTVTGVATVETGDAADDDEDGYDVQSFEDVSESEDKRTVLKGECDDELPDKVADAGSTYDGIQASGASEGYSEFSEENSAAEDEIPEGDDAAAADSVQSEVEEEEGQQFEVGEVGGAQSEGHVDSEDEGYENDYENESFADAQSIASVHSIADGNEAIKDSIRSEHAAIDANVSDVALVHDAAAQSDAASEYTEDDFEQGSETEAAPSVHSKADKQDEVEQDIQDSLAAAAPSRDLHVNDEDATQLSVSEQELSAALATVTNQLGGRELEHVGTLQHSSIDNINTAFDRADESMQGFTASVLTPALESRLHGQSMSTSSEEEMLTKSIEERMARLEALKACIMERQSDIRQVHKQLRIEKRKEALTAEEEALWAEADGLEHELQCDVASLKLIRQRNRLEFNRLEARQQYAPAHPLGHERDLLVGFDYIEAVEPCVVTMASLHRDADVQTPLGVEVECQTVPVPAFKEKELTASYSRDLLSGYDYIEQAQQVLPHATMAIGQNEESESQSNGIESLICVAADNGAVSEADEQSVDLLCDFDYAEAIEPVCALETDLLAEYDYLEAVNPLVEPSELLASPETVAVYHSVDESGVGSSEGPTNDENAIEDPSSNDISPTEMSSAANDEAADETGVAPSEPITTVAKPESDDEVDEDDSIADVGSEGEDVAHGISTSHNLEEDAYNDGDHEPVLGADGDKSNPGELGRTVEDGEESTLIKDGQPLSQSLTVTVNMVASLILTDLLQDARCATDMLELNAWRQMRSRGQQLSHASKDKSSPLTQSEGTRVDTSKRDELDHNRDGEQSESLQPEIVDTIDAAVMTGHAPSQTLESEDFADQAARVDTATESIFTSVFDDVLTSQLRAGATRRTALSHPATRLLTMPQCDEATLAGAASPSQTPNSLLSQPHQVCRMDGNASDTTQTTSRRLFIDQALNTLEVHDNFIRLGSFRALNPASLGHDSARLLYDAIEEIGQSALDAHRVADPVVSPAPPIESTEEVLSALHWTIRRELEAAQSMQTELHETVDRQLQALADADDQMDEEDVALLRRFSVGPTSLSNLVTTAAPTWVARLPMALSTSSAALTPRTPTPTSRGKSRVRRSLLTLARSRQAAELQRRVTSSIFDDLLADATSMLSQAGANHVAR